MSRRILKQVLPLSLILASSLSASSARAAIVGPTPIQHVVIIDMENHTFDNVLGKLCVVDGRCDGVTTGVLPDGTTIPLAQATNVVASVAHNRDVQRSSPSRLSPFFGKLA